MTGQLAPALADLPGQLDPMAPLPPEFVHDGLPGAINIPLNEIRRSVVLLDAEREYVAYCQSGRRGSAAALLHSQRGLRVSVVAGGLRGRPSILPETISQ